MGLSPIRTPRYVKDILRLPTQKGFLPRWTLQNTGSPVRHQSQTSDLMTSPELGEIGSREKELILALIPRLSRQQLIPSNGEGHLVLRAAQACQQVVPLQGMPLGDQRCVGGTCLLLWYLLGSPGLNSICQGLASNQ